jgi:hypothetical protein
MVKADDSSFYLPQRARVYEGFAEIVSVNVRCLPLYAMQQHYYIIIIIH